MPLPAVPAVLPGNFILHGLVTELAEGKGLHRKPRGKKKSS